MKNLKEDIKRYFLFRFSNFKMKRLFSLTTARFLLFLVSVYIVFRLTWNLQLKAIVLAIILFLYVICLELQLFKSGIHRHWYRKKQGIPTRNDIKQIKEKENEEILQIGNSNG